MFLLIPSGCIENGQFGIRGEGPIVERKVTLERIKGISLPGSARIYLAQGPNQEVRISGQENIIENLKLDVSGEVWNIGNKRSVWHSEPLKIFITMETLRLIHVSGSGDVELTNHFTSDKNLDIDISGSGTIQLDMDTRDLKAHISGSGDIFMKGSAEDVDLRITGSGSVHGFDFSVRNAVARISGSGEMQIAVENSLSAHITGSGSVTYTGNPKLDTSVSGSGSVHSR